MRKESPMVFLTPISLSSSLKRGIQHFPKFFLHINKHAVRRQKIFYILNFAVAYTVHKRSFRCGAIKLDDQDGDCPVNPFDKHINRMCPLKLENKHHDLINKYKSSYCSNSKQFYKDALFVLGPMGSGKTTFINNKILTHKLYGNYAYVDTDEIMEKLPGFSKIEVNKFYPLARQIAIKLTDWLLDNQLSFVAEGTCVQYQELIDYMIRLKRQGYSIKVCKLTKIELDLVLQRASQRKSRKMELIEVEDIYTQSFIGLDKLFEFNNKDTVIFEHIEIEDL